MVPRTGSNYREDVGSFTILSGGRAIGSVESAKRVYTARGMPTTEAGLHTRGVSQVYISIGEVADGAVSVRAYHKPLVLLIWLGAIVMAAGGTLSLADRRHRIGVPARARRAALAEGVNASATPA